MPLLSGTLATSMSALTDITVDEASGDHRSKTGGRHRRFRGVPFVCVLLSLVIAAILVPVVSAVVMTTLNGNAVLKARAMSEVSTLLSGLHGIVERSVSDVESVLFIIENGLVSGQYQQSDINSTEQGFLNVVRGSDASIITMMYPDASVAGVFRTGPGSYSAFKQNANKSSTCQMPIKDFNTMELTGAVDFCVDQDFNQMTEAAWGVPDIFRMTTNHSWLPIVSMSTSAGPIPFMIFITDVFHSNGTVMGCLASGWAVTMLDTIVKGDILNGLAFLVDAETSTFLASTDSQIEVSSQRQPTKTVEEVHNRRVESAAEAVVATHGSWREVPSVITSTHWTAREIVSTARVRRNGINWVLVAIVDPELQTVQWAVIGTILGITAAAVAGSVVFGLWVTSPINKIAREMANISLLRFGERDQRKQLSLSSIHEIRRIQKSHARLSSGTEALTKFVPAPIVMELMRSSTGDVDLGMHPKHLAILFTDLRGFTTLSERLTLEQTQGMLTEWFQEFGLVISQHQGTIDKFIGDSIMVLFNDPVVVPNPEFQACMTALRFPKAMEAVRQKTGLPLDYRVGVHCGTALVGNLGYRDRVNYTVCGNTVNVASRMEQLGKEYGLCPLVSGTLRDAVKDDFLFALLDVVRLRGHVEHLTRVYHLLAPAAAATREQQSVALRFDEIHRHVSEGDTEVALEEIARASQAPECADYAKALQTLRAHISVGDLRPESYAASS
eukprot:m51a1_g431 hypothetical protein (728) ;mRNA; r:44664-46847